MSRQIIQIVPRLPPSISGVGDYAYLLAKQLRAAHDIQTRFVLCDPSEVGDNDFDNFRVDRMRALSADEFERRIGGPGVPETVLLHYSGYGYQKRGCPVWLVRGIDAWKSRGVSRRLIVMFHELYASGPIWRSSFWTSSLQRALVKSLARAADHCLTNIRRNVPVLTGMTSNVQASVSVLPVFSNVGEPKTLPPFSERKPRMVVFGGGKWRRQAYIDHRDGLKRACQELEITEIMDIGPTCGAIPEPPVPCVFRGTLPENQISGELLLARAGFFTCPAPYLGKSGIFAAYAAHRLLPVTFPENVANNQDALRPGEHFLPISRTHSHYGTDIETIGRNVHCWYEEHSLEKQAARYATVIERLALKHQFKNEPLPAYIL